MARARRGGQGECELLHTQKRERKKDRMTETLKERERQRKKDRMTETQ